MIKFLGCLLIFVSSVVFAAERYQFNDSAKQAQFAHLTAELRCLVCQNENLADSNADLAKDLRQEIYAMVQAGQTNQQIINYLTARYGDFILFKPPFVYRTYLLWLGPFLLLLGGILFVFKFIVTSVRKTK